MYSNLLSVKAIHLPHQIPCIGLSHPGTWILLGQGWQELGQSTENIIIDTIWYGKYNVF